MLAEQRILAIDYGERRIGLALSDPMGIIATGLGTWMNSTDLMEKLSALVRERHIVRIIVGLPLTLRGTRGTMAEMVMTFVEALRSVLSVPVEPVDERLTSVLAERTIRDLGVGRKKRREKGKVDELAAVHLLQGYLDRLVRQKKHHEPEHGS